MRTLSFFYVVLIVLLCIPLCLAAQSNKPTSGILLEVGFAPFAMGVNANDIDNNNEFFVSNNSIVTKQITIRKLKSNNTAMRLSANLDYNTESSKAGSYDSSQHSFLLGLQGGYEIHRTGTDKLSPYFGGVAGLNFHSAGQDVSGDNYDSEVTGGWMYYDEYEDYKYIDFDYTLSNRSYTQVLLQGIVGCDYYFAKDIYLGFEVNYGLDYKMHPKVEMTTTYGSETEKYKLADEASSFNFGKSMNSMLRLGFRL